MAVVRVGSMGKEIGKFTYPVVGQVGEELVDRVYVGVEFEHVDDVWFEVSDVSIAAGEPRACILCVCWDVELEKGGFRKI